MKPAKPKNQAERAARVRVILEKLDEMYPNATCALNYKNPWQLLVATILSAQCTDKRVNAVTPELFAKYPTPRDFAAARHEVLANDIRSTGFFNNKAKSVIGAAKMIVNEFGGKVPKTMEELIAGTGRRAQDRECRAGHGVRDRVGRSRRYARAEGFAPARSDEADRPGENRAGPDEDRSEGALDSLFAPDHPSWPGSLRGAQAEVCGMQAEPGVLRAGQNIVWQSKN